MSSQGTGVALFRAGSSGGAASGMAFKCFKLTAPMAALNPKTIANCQEAGLEPRHAAANKSAATLAAFTQTASRAKNLPRKDSGTRVVIHGSQAQLEMPRERLNPKSKNNNKASCEERSRNTPARGTAAMAKMKATRVPQPA